MLQHSSRAHAHGANLCEQDGMLNITPKQPRHKCVLIGTGNSKCEQLVLTASSSCCCHQMCPNSAALAAEAVLDPSVGSVVHCLQLTRLIPSFVT